MTRALPGPAVWLGQGVIVTLPFCAMIKPGLLGNFDANLALWPLLALLPILVLSPAFWDTVLMTGAEGRALRLFALCLGLAAVWTLLNGMRFSAQGITAYGTDPWHKSRLTAVVPLLLAGVVMVGATLGRCLPQAQLAKALRLGFGLTVGYVAVQALSALWPNAGYDALWPVFEGARSGSESYVSRFSRLSGPTMEAAELAKMMMILWLPWALIPIQGTARATVVGCVILITAATLSLVGLTLSMTVLSGLILFGAVGPRVRIGAVVLGGLLVVALLWALWSEDPGPVVTRLFHRITTLEQDPSAVIRATYNRAALGLITEHPFIGLGWSNEVFFFPHKISHISYLWEVQNDLSTGNALTAKSLWLRLAMYLGLPGLTVFLWAGAQAARGPQVRVAFALLAGAGLIDGGMVTSLYLWAGPALCLGAQMRSEGSA